MSEQAAERHIGPSAGEPADPPRRHRRTGRRAWMVGAIVVLAVPVAAATVLVVRNRSGAPTPAAATPLATAAVVRTDLVRHQQADGTLGYGGSTAVPGRAGAGAVLTWLPAVGQVVQRGQELYGVNGAAVPLFYGAAPLWRPLSDGVPDGPDVQELEDNLRALGFGGGLDVDDHFSPATKDAVRSWQRALGVPDNGVVAPADVVMAPGAVRVTTVGAALGAAPTGTLLTVSSTDRVVTVNLPVAEQQLAAVGAEVGVELPNGSTTPGKVTEVGTVATAPPTPAGGDNQGQGQNGTADATIMVRVGLERPADAGTLDGAPVTVDFTSAVHRGVLAVPVTALLATPNGGYAVDVVAAGQARRVDVQLGFFAGGLVEVSGQGLAPGVRVQVPEGA